MTFLTIDELKLKDTLVLDSMLKKEVVHIKKDEEFKYVIMTEDNYKRLLSKNFGDETLYSFEQYGKNEIKKGSADDLFGELGI
ncbi:MAG: hypothetical protein JW982_00345 [Spirochaetes bacterium]|nr:hypothetical protein [Spirochaetota bacterium]